MYLYGNICVGYLTNICLYYTTIVVLWWLNINKLDVILIIM